MLFLQTMTTETKIDGSLLNSINAMFTQFGIYQILFAFFIVSVTVLIYKFISAKISNMSNDKKDILIADLTEKITNLNSRKNNNGIDIDVNIESTQTQNNIPPHKMVQKIDIEEFHDLRKHPYFSNIDYWLYVKIHQVNISNENKRNIFIDYMCIKYGTSKKRWYDFVSDTYISKMSKEELASELLKVTINISKEVDKELLSMGMPRLVIEKMDETTSLADKFMVTTINSFCNNQQFDDSFDIVFLLLNYYMNIIEVLFYDFMVKLEKMNGQLDNANYTSKILNNKNQI